MESAWARIVGGEGGEEAWTWIRERARPAVLERLRARIEGRREAEEHAERFLALLNRPDVRVTVPQARAFLAALLRQFVSHLRRRVASAPEREPDFDDAWARGLLLFALRRFRERFPQVHAVLLRAHEGAAPSPAEMGAALGVPPAEAVRRLAEARERLRGFFLEEVRGTVAEPSLAAEEAERLRPYVRALVG